MYRKRLPLWRRFIKRFTFLQVMCAVAVIGIVASIFTDGPDKLFADYGQMQRSMSMEDKANRIIKEERETQFRQCLRDAAGQVGVATLSQESKCKEKFLNR